MHYAKFHLFLTISNNILPNFPRPKLRDLPFDVIRRSRRNMIDSYRVVMARRINKMPRAFKLDPSSAYEF